MILKILNTLAFKTEIIIMGTKIKFLLFAFYFFTITQSSRAQFSSEGIPFITNYPKNIYKAGTQNWSITQNSEGEIFFANNSGLIRFDATSWYVYPMPNNSVVRVVHADNDGRVYAGAFEEFGYFERNSSGFFQYHSLSALLPQKNNFGEVWRIHKINNIVYFQSFTAIYAYNGQIVYPILENRQFQFSFALVNRLFVFDVSQGLLELVDSTGLTNTITNDLDNIGDIVAIHQMADKNLALISSKGLFVQKKHSWEKKELNTANKINNFQIYSAQFLSDTVFALGTIHQGLYLMHTNGKIISHIQKEQGLINNTILSMFFDHSGNLWLGLDNGISYMEINSPFSVFSEAKGIMGTGYSSAYFENRLYFGTNQGLYVYDLSKGASQKAEFIEGTGGQVWNLFVHDNKLFCGHHEGVYVVEKNTARKISKEIGNWIFVPIKAQPEALLVGTYNGLSLLKKSKAGQWQFFRKLEGLNESSRILRPINDSTLWMSHGYKGIYRIFLDKDLSKVKQIQFYNKQQGLPSNFVNDVFSWRNQFLFSTEDGIYSFDENTKRFYRNSDFAQKFKQQNPCCFTDDKAGNTWYINNGKVAFLSKMGESVNNIFNKIGNTLVTGFEHFNLLDSGIVIIATENGFVCYQQKPQLAMHSTFRTIFQQIKLTGSNHSFLIGNQAFFDNDVSMPYKNNSVYFSFSAPFFENSDKTLYSTYLIGFDEQWSKWVNRKQKEYTNLPPGKYIFKVRALNVYGEVSKTAEFRFSILVPWYRTYLAYFIYIFFSVIFAYIVSRFISLRIEKDKNAIKQKQQELITKQKEEHDKIALLAEQEIIKLRNAMLQTEIERKNLDFDLKKKELATVALKNTHKNEILLNIKDQLLQMESKIDSKAFMQVNKLIKSIDDEIRLDQDWELFKKHFEAVHGDFFKRLKQHYPDLTPKDLKLCAYLRINLSSKEIAHLMNISVRGVEIGRYRLRKKLFIDSDQNLFEFMLQI